MNNFTRAISLCLRRPLTLSIALACSLAVAGFWGANISIVYPLMEVLFRGRSPIQAVEEDIAASRASLEQTERQIAVTQERIGSAPAGQRVQLEKSLSDLQQTQRDAQRIISKRKAMRGWAQWLPQRAFSTLIALASLLLVGTIVKNLFLMLNTILVERVVRLAMLGVQRDYFVNSLRLDAESLGAITPVELTSRFAYDMGTLTTALRSTFGRATIEPLKMLACLIGAGLLSWRLLLVSLFFVPLVGMLMQLLAKSMKRANRRGMEEMSRLVAQLAESIDAVQVVKAYTMESYERSRFAQRAKTFYRRAMKITFYNALTKPVSEMFGVGVVAFALMAGGYLVLSGHTHLLGLRVLDTPLKPELFITFFALLAGVADPARKLSNIFALIQPGWPAADRVFEVVDRSPKINDSDQRQAVASPHSLLRLDNVSFRYGDGPEVLKRFTLDVPYGQSLAIVGPNGCGKSTLINLLARFYDPNDGSLQLDGIDLRDMKLNELRERFGFVSQQSHLFDDTVRSNIRYGSPQANESDIENAARRANAHSFVLGELENGYDTIVGPRGNRLSGGQRQRIALARAILRDPEILILDEATSQVDIESERLIHAALQEFIQGRTAVMVTHRLSTLELAERILVMEEGSIVDVGTHAELLGRCEFYRRLHALELRKTA